MRFLGKHEQSPVIAQGLAYKVNGNNARLREALLKEQSGYCAYSEAFFRPIDLGEIDHFDPRLKNKPEDHYKNWYVIYAKHNRKRKRDIKRFLPMLMPSSAELTQRIKYDDGIFQPVDLNDQEAFNLIDFLGMNDAYLVESRQKHVDRLRGLKADYGSDEKFVAFLAKHKAELSFITALEHELNLNLSHLI
jgi:hypothetical protein